MEGGGLLALEVRVTTSAHRRFGPFPTIEVAAKRGLQQEEADCKHRAKCAVYVLS